MPYKHCNSAEPPGDVVALLNRYKMILRNKGDAAKKARLRRNAPICVYFK